MLQRIEYVEETRKDIAKKVSPLHKSKLGQYFTPTSIANFMASLYSFDQFENIRLLDAGAGVGSLSASFLERWLVRDYTSHIDVIAYEIDPQLEGFLNKTLSMYTKLATERHMGYAFKINENDFIEDTVNLIQFGGLVKYSHAILNPPYKKILSKSRHRKLLHAVGIETANLYSAFVALTIKLMEPKGEIVAIIPRSFCNGLYFKHFRNFLLSKTAINHIHLFSSRNKAFKDDSVLQENIIIHLIKSGRQRNVTVSSSTDDTFSDYVINEFPFERIVKPEDKENLIFIPTMVEMNPIETSKTIYHSIEKISVEVSTGPVVDFRVKSFLRNEPMENTVPLLYPGHFIDMKVKWPNYDLSKSNYIQNHEETRKWLLPNGYYVVVRRFSSKEEKRRIVASIVEPHVFGSMLLGFENHLNIFHENKGGLLPELAYGLAVYLNSSVVDQYFRLFNGHTQVNATDLRLMKYPNREILIKLGTWAKSVGIINQEAIDKEVGLLL
ncbi:MAG: N-6 DNA methylase [Chloroflexi bacterium]|nr:N-6 DNA methylase [Chloroflexota bacterium]